MIHYKNYLNTPVPYYEGLQNMDASFLYHEDSSDKFATKLKTPDDPDLSGILQDNFFNTSLFGTYDTNLIDLDVKYFNNISHVLMMYNLREVLP
jgi:hypothetical protein